MLQKIISIKNTLQKDGEENYHTACELTNEQKHSASEYYRGKAIAYAIAAEMLEKIIKNELPWEE